MPASITNYQCPNCSGPLHFSSEDQKLKCDYCGSLFTVEEAAALFQEKNDAAAAADIEEQQQEAAEINQWSEEEAKKLRAYSCPSCGAELICDKNTAATSCPYCGNPTVVPSQFKGALKPDYILPFKMNKDQAVSRLKEYYKGKIMLPKAFSDENHIEEIKGVYVPFWLYDGRAAADLSYRGDRVFTQTTPNETITTTEHYRIQRSGTVSFEKVPADASSKMPDELMDAIEPFDYKDMVPFDMSYLPGYLADKYDVSAESDAERADVRMKNSAINEIRSTITGYTSLIAENEHINIHPGHVHYAFLPVWMLSTKWNGENYLFAMNGQTGKFIGDLPVDNKRFWMFFAIYALIGMLILAAVFFFM